MEEHLQSPPAWLPLLNSLHRDWREAEILKGRNPDPYIEQQLRQTGKWPAGEQSRH